MNRLKIILTHINFEIINIDVDHNLKNIFKINKVPSIIVSILGKKVIKLEQNISSSLIVQLVSNVFSQRKKKIKSHLKTLINSNRVMIFTKGKRNNSYCEFNKLLFKLFTKINLIDFGIFNILKDKEVRQELKIYSNWKTYPQIYIDGKLIGGVDIIKELIEDGNFQKILPNVSLFETQIKNLIKKNETIILIKGTSVNCKCSFSKSILGLFRKINYQDYEIFNTFSDQKVFRSLKKKNLWPTYPQIYFNGELIGGLDICFTLLKNYQLKRKYTYKNNEIHKYLH